MTPTWDSLEVRQLLPALWHACTRLDVIKYAAGSGDFYALHLDPDAAGRAPGQLVLPGRFKQALLGRMVSEWLGHRGFVRSLGCRYLGADPVGQPLTCKGEVRRCYRQDGARRVELRLWIEDAVGRSTTLGSATVEWTGD